MSFALQLLPHLKDKRLVLASGSPRRRELMTRLAFDFEIVPSQFPELLDKQQFPSAKDYVLETARQKGCEVWQRLLQAEPQSIQNLILISADTIVTTRDHQILEKPQSKEHALEMLQSLNNDSHLVQTAVCLFYQGIDGSMKCDMDVETTHVVFADNSEDTLRLYVESGEPMDKAGAYGYQGLACVLVKEIQGCYYNVVGFPVHLLVRMLSSLNVT